MLTPDDVHNVSFTRTWRRSRGYDEAEVDELLTRVEATLRGKPLVTARDVLRARFSPGKPGRAYKKTQVAEFLDQVALTLMKREVREADQRVRSGSGETAPEKTAREKAVARRPDPVASVPRPEPVERTGEPVPAGREVLASATAQQPALDKAEVDAFMDRVEATLRGADELTAQDVLNARFNPPGPGQPGYQEASVFAFLVMVSTIIKQMAPQGRLVPAQRLPIGRAFPRALHPGAPRLTSEAVGSVVLRGSAEGERGYHEDEVDDFLDRVVATLRGADNVTSEEVHTVTFSEQPDAGTGYDQAEVDSLLDLIAERLETDSVRPRP